MMQSFPKAFLERASTSRSFDFGVNPDTLPAKDIGVDFADFWDTLSEQTGVSVNIPDIFTSHKASTLQPPLLGTTEQLRSHCKDVRGQKLRPEDWDEQKQTIAVLYIMENKSLQLVEQMMEEKGFYAK
jgi:hypothetical protein